MEDNRRMRVESSYNVFIYNFGGPDNFKKVQDILGKENIEYEKKQTRPTNETKPVTGLSIKANLYPKAQSEDQKYTKSVEHLKKLLSEFPQLKYFKLKMLQENKLRKNISSIVKEEMSNYLKENEKGDIEYLKNEINEYKQNSAEIKKLEDQIKDTVDKIKKMNTAQNQKLKTLIKYMTEFEVAKVEADDWVASLESVAKYKYPSTSYKEVWMEALSKLNQKTVDVLKKYEADHLKAKAAEKETVLKISDKEKLDENLIIFLKNGFNKFVNSFKSFLQSLKSYTDTVKALPKINLEEGTKGYHKSGDKVEIKSALEKVAQDVWGESNLEKAKEIFTNFVSSSKIKEEDRKKMLNTVDQITNKRKLDNYLVNALLKYEGMSLKESSLKEEMYEDISGTVNPNEVLKYWTQVVRTEPRRAIETLTDLVTGKLSLRELIDSTIEDIDILS